MKKFLPNSLSKFSSVLRIHPKDSQSFNCRKAFSAMTSNFLRVSTPVDSASYCKMCDGRAAVAGKRRLGDLGLLFRS